MKYTSNRQLEEKSKAELNKLISDVGWIYRVKDPDVGIDVEIEIVEGEEVTEKVIWIQLKATEDIDHNKKVTYSMHTKHLKYYETCHLPVIIIFWIKSKNEFYYLFAQEYIQEILSKNKPKWREQKNVSINFSSKLENIEELNTVATNGWLYILNRQFSKDPQFWLDGIPKSDNKTLKELTLKALFYYKKEKHAEAIKEYENILKVCNVFTTERMSILLHLSNSYYSLSNYEKALLNYKALLDIAKGNDKETLIGKGNALSGIGIVHRNKGDLDKALNYYEEALKIYKEIGYKYGEAANQCNIGVVYSEKGDLGVCPRNIPNSSYQYM